MKKVNLKGFFALAAVIIGISGISLLTPMTSFAGATLEYSYCYKYAAGNGYCYGNFLGFRKSPDSTAYASFEITPTASHFYAVQAGIFYTCMPNASVAGIWDKAMGSEGFFSISWDTTGTCTGLSLQNGSRHKNY
jgi:hypothetical protein